MYFKRIHHIPITACMSFFYVLEKYFAYDIDSSGLFQEGELGIVSVQQRVTTILIYINQDDPVGHGG